MKNTKMMKRQKRLTERQRYKHKVRQIKKQKEATHIKVQI
jgi:hypothetical protein